MLYILNISHHWTWIYNVAILLYSILWSEQAPYLLHKGVPCSVCGSLWALYPFR